MEVKQGQTYRRRYLDANGRRSYMTVKVVEVLRGMVKVQRTDAPEIVTKVSPTTLEPVE